MLNPKEMLTGDLIAALIERSSQSPQAGNDWRDRIVNERRFQYVLELRSELNARIPRTEADHG